MSIGRPPIDSGCYIPGTADPNSKRVLKIAAQWQKEKARREAVRIAHPDWPEAEIIGSGSMVDVVLLWSTLGCSYVSKKLGLWLDGRAV